MSFVKPMLAFNYSPADAVFPLYVQPKLDGMRCIATLMRGKCTLKTRTGKAINSVPHIAKQLLDKFGDHELLVLDGELYVHDLRDDFSGIISIVRASKPKKGHEKLEYWVYDCISATVRDRDHIDYMVESSQSFKERYMYLKECEAVGMFGGCLRLLRTESVNSHEGLLRRFREMRNDGYEGLMTRSPSGEYVHRRSKNLQKMKEFDTYEYRIIGVEEGVGTMRGCAIFVCASKHGEFRCKMIGTLQSLEKFVAKPSLAKGKWLTVKYQGFTSGDLPRFPIGLCIRDYE